jgi:hypothetical protein
MRMALAMVLVLDLAATATLASLHGTRTLRKGFGLRRERPSSYAHRHAQSQHKRRDQQSYALPHLLTPFAYSRRDGPAYSCLRVVYVRHGTKYDRAPRNLRTSQNAQKAKFAEFLFHALG